MENLDQKRLETMRYILYEKRSQICFKNGLEERTHKEKRVLDALKAHENLPEVGAQWAERMAEDDKISLAFYKGYYKQKTLIDGFDEIARLLRQQKEGEKK